MSTIVALPLTPRVQRSALPRPVLAVVEDGPAGPAVVRAASNLARAAAAEVVLVVPVEAGPRLTTDPAVARARHRRLDADASAVAARVIPRLEALGLRWSVQRLDVRPSARGRRHAVDATLRLARRRAVSAVFCPVASCSSSGLEADTLQQRRRPSQAAIPVVGVATDPELPRPVLTWDGRRRLAERAEDLRRDLGEFGRQVAAGREDGRLRLEFDRVAGQLAELEALLAEAADVPDDGCGTPVVRLGSMVVVEAADGEQIRVRPVHPAEAHLDRERISMDSPLAVALLGRSAGDVVTVAAPAGSYPCRVLDVRPVAAASVR